MIEDPSPMLPPGSTEPEIYKRMRLARRFDELVVELRLAGRIEGVVHVSYGQEAIAAGICAYLGPGDRITSTHRGHAQALAKGADPSRMMAELLGRAEGYCRGKGGSMHIADFSVGMLGSNGIVGAGLPITNGAALAAQMDGDGAVAVCFFSDGAVGGGPIHEALNIAALWALPTVFVCENNEWASATPTNEGLAISSIHELGGGYGIAHAVVDGNDIGEVLRAGSVAVEHARSGSGPFLLEAKTYRLAQHAFRDALLPERRDPEVLRAWWARDPLLLHAESMRSRGVLDDAGIEDIHKDVEAVLDEALRFAEASPFPAPTDALEGLFAG